MEAKIFSSLLLPLGLNGFLNSRVEPHSHSSSGWVWNSQSVVCLVGTPVVAGHLHSPSLGSLASLLLSFQTQHKSILCFCSPPWEKLAGETGTCLATSVTPLNEASGFHPTFKWILTHNYPGIVNWSLPTSHTKTRVLRRYTCSRRKLI